MTESNIKIAVVMVTYNRIECLKTALKKYEDQSKLPAYIVVVNNASTDSTKEYLENWKNETATNIQKIVIHCNENTGGSGGFSRGMEEAIKLDCDFLFLADDDAYAEPDMLKELEIAYNSCNKDEVAALCTAIFNYTDYEITHRCKIKKNLFNIKLIGLPKENYSKDKFEIDTLSFVGAAIKIDTVQRIGLPKKEYFIYFDDVEYSLRIRKEGKIICVPKSIMHHDVGHNSIPAWKYYYDIRNWIDMIRCHYNFWYYICAVALRYIKHGSILAQKRKGKEYSDMCKTAIKDSMEKKLGKSNIYSP